MIASSTRTRWATAAVVMAIGWGCGGSLPQNTGEDLTLPGSDDGGGGNGEDLAPPCGNGVLDTGEQCDNGAASNTTGSGCEPDCRFTCVNNMRCDDGDACNGAETCRLSDHTCQKGTPLTDGASCGMGKSCKMGVCGDVACGDKVVDGGEECDDGNNVPGDGCDACRFSCVATDVTRNCAPLDACAGAGVCDGATHRCLAGTPLADGTACNGNMGYCKMGACTKAVCGDGTVEPGEVCDRGGMNGPNAGCELDCKLSCVNAATDCKGAPPACQKWSCDSKPACVAVADTAKDGMACGMNLICKAGACASPQAMCGNGVVETGEDCDFGSGNGAGTGCEVGCKFSCALSPNSCVAAPCQTQPACAAVTVNGHAGQKCGTGTPLTDGTSCGMGNLICRAGACQPSTCGDGFVDSKTGEQCEPPNSTTCDVACHLKAVCGNGVREGTEQCDDGNLVALDGCSSSCGFEQDQRVNWLKMQFGTDMFCTTDALGGAIVSGIAQGQLQTSLDTGVGDGSITILFAMTDLTDLTGTSQSSLNIGVVNGTPMRPMGAPAYNGATDLDWWYAADPMSLDMARAPTAKLAGAINARVLTGGPGKVGVTLVLGGAPGLLSMSNVRVTVGVNAVSTPLVSTGLPPGHVAAEHLLPTLQSYASTGQQNANGAGKLCGNVSTSSLAKVPLPAAVLQNCTNYTMANSMLDLLVGGCTAFGFLQIVRATQPDQVDASAPVAGAGGPYRLAGNAQRVVNTCRDRNNAVVNLATCLDAAAYSSFFKFTTDRVIIKQ